MSVKMRQEVERKIVTAFIQSALVSGAFIEVDNGDWDETFERFKGLGRVLRAMFTTDEDTLFLFHTNDPEETPFGWVHFIYGNDGWDVIHDYTTNLEPMMYIANKVSKHYAD